jgi:dipeptidyl aminopeptidase/acylaminoacyl peptidase
MKISRTLKFSADAFIPGSSTYDAFIPEIPQQIHITEKGFISVSREEICFKNIYSGKKEWNFSLKILNELLKGVKRKETDKFPVIHFLREKKDCCWFLIHDVILFLDLSSRKIICKIPVKKGWKNFDFNEEKGIFSFTCKNGLYLLDRKGETSTVYVNKSSGVLAGSIPSREEFGITRGTFWSPKGSYLAFYITDERQVIPYPLVHIQDPVAFVEKIKYPMAGQRSQRINLAVYSIEKKEYILLDGPEEEYAYLSCVTWSPDEKYIYLAEITRSQKRYRLKRYNAGNGSAEPVLFSEEDEKYVEPQHPLFFPNNNPEQFIWQSRQDGFNHLYLYSKKGNLIRQLTKGNWEITGIAGYYASGNILIVGSTITSALNRDICSVNMETGEIKLLSREPGIHQVFMSDKSDFYIDRFCSSVNPGRLSYHFLSEGNDTKIIYQAPDPFKFCKIPKTETAKMKKDTNSPEIFYRITYPPDFIRTKKYPLIFYVYGGPHVQLIRNEWFTGSKGFEFFMAAHGYIVLSIDPRGSDNRGKDFENAIWKDIGKVQLEDYQFAIHSILSEKKYIDKKKLGVYGWSFGGFMSISLMLKIPGLFKAGIAGGAVVDWALYEVMYTERYMETPIENPDGYENNNLRNFVGQLEGSLLLIHCDNDPVVLWQHTLSLLKESIRKNKQIDYFVYPGQAHNVQGPERLHLMYKIKRYFDEKLK